jgi:hypothetical protein
MTYTFEELKQFVLSQPDEQPIDMADNIGNNRQKCGCILVQFGRMKRPSYHIRGCSVTHIFFSSDEHIIPLEEDHGRVFNFIASCIDNDVPVKNFKIAKEMIQKI